MSRDILFITIYNLLLMALLPSPATRRRFLANYAVLLSVQLVLSMAVVPPPRPDFGRLESNQSNSEAARYNSDGRATERRRRCGAPQQTSIAVETWHAYFIQGKKVGFIHVSNRIDDENLDKQVLTTIDESLMFAARRYSIRSDSPPERLGAT